MVHERAGHLLEVACAVQPAECGVRSQVATYPCQGVGEVRGQPGISSGLANRGAGAGQRSVRLQGHQGDESQEGRGYAGGCHCVPSRYIPPPACHLYATCARSSDLHDLRFTNSLCSVQRRPPAPEIGLNSDIFGALSSLAFAHDRMRWRSGCRGALLTYPAVDRQTGTDEHGPSDEHAPAGRAR